MAGVDTVARSSSGRHNTTLASPTYQPTWPGMIEASREPSGVSGNCLIVFNKRAGLEMGDTPPVKEKSIIVFSFQFYIINNHIIYIYDIPNSD